tara:strand:+ start:490 stop:1101 length:612 start_codon:yes stop_codon:yes gene_type:complete
MAVGSTSPLKWDPFGFGKRRRASEDARKNVTQELQRFEQLDVGIDAPQATNIYAGMENVYEDQTVDQRAAEFARQSSQQQQANIMEGLQGAGGFDISKIQALQSQADAAAQQGAASIAQQERQNQQNMLGQAANLQMLQRQGEESARQQNLERAMRRQDLTWQKQQGILAAKTGMAEAAEQARQQGIQNAIAIGQAVGGIVGG